MRVKCLKDWPQQSSIVPKAFVRKDKIKFGNTTRLKYNDRTQILAITVERLHYGDLLLAGGGSMSIIARMVRMGIQWAGAQV